MSQGGRDRPSPAFAPVVVVGAGAAGLMAAIHAAGLAGEDGDAGRVEGARGSPRGRRVLLLERTADGGRKILISGGGRCNVLPSAISPKQFVTSSSPNSLKKLLLSWPLAEQRRFFEERLGLRLVREEETGKLFPASNRARDVRDGLVRLAAEAGAELRFGARVVALRPLRRTDDGEEGRRPDGAAGRPEGRLPGTDEGAVEGGVESAAEGAAEGASEGAAEGAADDARWLVALEGGGAFRARSVVLATGGLSVPATGSDGGGLAIARALGHTVSPTYPALTPLTADPPVHAALAGVSLPVGLSAPMAGGAFTAAGGFLFTHRGYSGPAVLDVSHVAVRSRLAGEVPPQPIHVRWTALDEAGWEAALGAGPDAPAGTGSGEVGPLVRRALPQRLADALLAEAGVLPDTRLSQLRREDRKALVGVLARYPLPWTGDEGYRKAEVTGGGVELGEVDPKTLESRKRAGLFLCGEILDAFGPIGGYNFAWAWATGRAAGLGAARG